MHPATKGHNQEPVEYASGNSKTNPTRFNIIVMMLWVWSGAYLMEMLSFKSYLFGWTKLLKHPQNCLCIVVAVTYQLQLQNLYSKASFPPSQKKMMQPPVPKILHPATLRPSGSLPPSNVLAHLRPARRSPRRHRRSPRCLVAPGEGMMEGSLWRLCHVTPPFIEVCNVFNSVVFPYISYYLLSKTMQKKILTWSMYN